MNRMQDQEKVVSCKIIIRILFVISLINMTLQYVFICVFIPYYDIFWYKLCLFAMQQHKMWLVVYG